MYLNGNTYFQDKNTALHFAVSRQHVDVVRLLVAANCDVNLLNKVSNLFRTYHYYYSGISN